MIYISQNCAVEWGYSSSKIYNDPFNEVQLDVRVTAPDGEEQIVPAFWAGEQTWGVRYASSKVGTHRYRTICSDESNADLNGQQGTLEVTPYEGNNPLLKHGPLRVASNCRHLEHRDGTPFFWLGDTWWLGLCKRLKWPEDFKELTADRVKKGFSLIQIVAGLYPDMKPFDARGANEAGFPWEKDFSRINPYYFDMVDLRIGHLVRSGLAPCIVGCWGFFMEFAGVQAIKKHWRNLIARYGAYPVVWCTAGEALMYYYLSSEMERYRKMSLEERIKWLPLLEKRVAWTDVMRSIRETDPYHHPITVHPTRIGHDQADDPSVMDIDMLQTGHVGYPTLTDTVNMLEDALAHEPKMPVLVGEVNYEGEYETNREEIQRFLFWSCILSGATGHTYGAQGIWQVNTKEKPYGPSPHGLEYGGLSWDDAYRLPGSGQLGLAKKFLERYEWWQFEPHPGWVEPHQTKGNRMAPYAAGIPSKVKMVFVPAEVVWLLANGQVTIKDLEPGVQYSALYFSPKDGVEYGMGIATGDAQGDYVAPKPPFVQDWVFVLERS